MKNKSYGSGHGPMAKDGGDKKPYPRDSTRRSHKLHTSLRKATMYPAELGRANDALRQAFNRDGGEQPGYRQDLSQSAIPHSHSRVRGSVAPSPKRGGK